MKSSNARPILREDLRDLREDVLETAGERFERRLTEETGAIRREMSQLRIDLIKEIASTRVELLKWSFLFWVGQLAGVTAIVSFLLRNS